MVAALGVTVTLEIADRRAGGFCRDLPGTVEHPTRWPLGERCEVVRPDGTREVWTPSWALTALVAVVVAALAAGGPAPARSARRRVAEAVVGPVALGIAVAVVATPPSLSRVVAVVTISLYLALVPAALTAVAVRHFLVAGWRPAVTVSWLAWAAAVFHAGRGGVGP